MYAAVRIKESPIVPDWQKLPEIDYNAICIPRCSPSRGVWETGTKNGETPLVDQFASLWALSKWH
jgi:hypothetical protein